MERPSPCDAMPKKEQRDEELDKRIEALRRKNEVLMKRHQEVEEDKKRAEEEGMALQSRKGKTEDLTITVNKSSTEPRVVVARPGSGAAAGSKPGGEPGDEDVMACGRGRRRQILVTMVGNKAKGGKRVVSERTEVRKPWLPVHTEGKTLTEDRLQRQDSGGRDKHPQTARRNPGAQDELWQVHRQAEECVWLSEGDQNGEGWGPAPPGPADLTVLTTREEQDDYLRWKTEREEIDRERVARHKNSKGQWRRAWDMDKTESMFSERSAGERDHGPPARGGRGVRRGQPKSSTDSRGNQTHVRGEKRGKAVPVVSSKAQGKDRLTGRARRWDASEEGEPLRSCETSLEEFLEELDALADPEGGGPAAEAPKVTEGELKTESSPVRDAEKQERRQQDDEGGVSSSVTVGVASAEEALPPKGSEKKVRFSDEVIRGAGDEPGASDAKVRGSLKDPSPGKVGRDVAERARAAKDGLGESGKAPDQGGVPAGGSRPPSSSTGRGRHPQVPEVPQVPQVPEVPEASRPECAESSRVLTSTSSSLADEEPSGEEPYRLPLQNSVQPLQHTKSNRNTEELIDSSLSVLNLESGESDPTRPSSTDQARENGKIV